VIDDVAPALAMLSEAGQQIVGPPAEQIREAVLSFVDSHGWDAIEHSRFAAWATAMPLDGTRALVLDPLLRPESFSPSAITARVTRAASARGWVLDEYIDAPARAALNGQRICLIDDSVATGSTVSHVAGQIRAAGGQMTRVLSCTSRQGSAVARLVVPIETFLVGPRRTVHLRDVIPGLPFAGRRIAAMDAVMTTRGRIPVRVPPLAGSLWDYIRRDPRVARSILESIHATIDGFRGVLGRPPRVDDIHLLGPNVAVPLHSRYASGGCMDVRSSSPLSQLMA
jgi:hypothetical protein